MSLLQHEVTDFTVNALLNNQIVRVSRKDLLGHWSVLFFYPEDFTFVCPTKLEDLQDHYADFKAIGCEVYSCSHDSEYDHKAWHDTSPKIARIAYPMLADPPPSWPRTSRSTTRTRESLTAATSSSTRTAGWSPTRSPRPTSGATPRRFSGACRPRSSSMSMVTASARRTGSRATIPSRRGWTSSGSCDSYGFADESWSCGLAWEWAGGSRSKRGFRPTSCQSFRAGFAMCRRVPAAVTSALSTRPGQANGRR